MTRPKSTAKRPTAKERANAAARTRITKKLRDELDAHNELVRHIEVAREELAQRKGRIQVLQEEAQEVGGIDAAALGRPEQ